MKFAQRVFAAAGVWGLLVLSPLYFLNDKIGRENPPAITHPEFFYGFIAVGLAWQVAFLVIASDPVRYRLLMVPAMLEKFGYVATVLVLFAQGRLPSSALVFAGTDFFLGVLFVVSFFRLGRQDSALAAQR
jgi:hypothetical protein